MTHDDRDDDLSRLIGRAFPPASTEPSDEQLSLLRRQVESAGVASEGAHRKHRHRRPPSRLLLTLAAAVLLVAGVAVGAGLDATLRQDDDLLARGTAEFEAELTGNGVQVELEGDAAPEGRIITLRSESLPVIPAGEYYELWFVADGEQAGGEEPKLISAGTFHPDDEGRTLVVLHAAVDPRMAGEVVITREPGDGDPAPSGEQVAEGSVDLVD